MTFQEETKHDNEVMPVKIGIYNDDEIFSGSKRKYEEMSPLAMRLTDGFNTSRYLTSPEKMMRAAMAEELGRIQVD